MTRLGIEQLNYDSLNKNFATDNELQNLVGVTTDVILGKLGILTESQKASIGVVQYVHPQTHSANMIEETMQRQFISQTERSKIASSPTNSEITNLISSVVLGLEWKERVETYAQLGTKYPNPTDGTAVHVRERNSVFRYNRSLNKWEDIIFTIMPDVTETVAGLMTPTLLTKLNSIQENANHYIHPDTHSADILVPGNNNTVFTHEDKAKLNAISATGVYEHPDTHSADMIDTTPERRFVSDMDIRNFRDKYTKREVDAKLAFIQTGMIPQPSVMTEQDFSDTYLNGPLGNQAQVGWTVEIETTGNKMYYKGNGEWINIGSTTPVVSESSNGVMTPELLAKLDSIEAGADKHKTGDGYEHLPVKGNDNYDKVLVAGKIGLEEEGYVDFLPQATTGTTQTQPNSRLSADGTFLLHFNLVINEQPYTGTDTSIEHVYTASSSREDITSNMITKLNAHPVLNKYFNFTRDVNITTRIVYKSKIKGKFDLNFNIEHLKTDINGFVLNSLDGKDSVIEKSWISVVTRPTGNGFITITLDDMNSGSYILEVHYYSGQSQSEIINNIKNEIISKTSYHVIDVSGSNPNTIHIIAGSSPADGYDHTDISVAFMQSHLQVDYGTVAQGNTGVVGVSGVTFPNNSQISGSYGLYFEDSEYTDALGLPFKYTFKINVLKGESPQSIATKFRAVMISNPKFSERYKVEIGLLNNSHLTIKRNQPGATRFTIIPTEIFSGLGMEDAITVAGVDPRENRWETPLTINGHAFGDIDPETLAEALGNSQLVNDVNELNDWKYGFDTYLNLSGQKLFDFLNDLFDSYRSGRLGGAVSIEGSFAGYSGVTRINHPFDSGTYSASVTSLENPNGRLGEVWIEYKNKYINVYNTGSFKGKFSAQIQAKSE